MSYLVKYRYYNKLQLFNYNKEILFKDNKKYNNIKLNNKQYRLLKKRYIDLNIIKLLDLFYILYVIMINI